MNVVDKCHAKIVGKGLTPILVCGGGVCRGCVGRGVGVGAKN